jgi:fibronectin-binding autotransporter adhesin
MTDVPSNLIPTRISQLPVAPVADENSQMMIIYQGNNYRIRVGDLLSVAGVPLTRQVIAGTGMAGGGQLSANVTLSIAPGGVGSTELAASGVTPGVYGNSTDIPIFTVDATGRVVAATTIPATITGYVPDTRQVIAGTGLTGGGALSSNVTLAAALSDLLPLIGDNAGAAGVSTEMARADHQHPAVDLSDQAQINGILPMDQGGTARSLVPDNGGIVWSGADGLYIGPAGVFGQVLVSAGQAEYIWASIDVDIPRPANTVRAGPVSGPDAIPTFRALVNADIPTTLDGKTLTNVDVNSGTIDGTVIGGSIAAAATGTTITANTQFTGPGTGLTGTATGLSIGGNAATATSATNVAGGTANQLVYNTGAGVTSFVTAPTVSSTFLKWTGSAFTWDSAGAGTVTSVDVSGGTTGLTTSGGPIINSGTITIAGTLNVANGGTGQTTYTDGQLLIGNSTGNTLAKATLTAGTGISVTNGSGSITIAATNNGTVTSVGGTGTVSGISLSGTVTSSGNLTLGGALDLSAPPAIGGATPNTATFTTVNATTFDTNVAAAGVTLSGTTLAADGTDTNINVLINTKGNAGVGIDGAPTGTVNGTTIISKFCVKGDGSQPLGAFVHANNVTAGSGSIVFACRSRGTVASPAVVQDDDSLASFVVAGFDGTDLALAARIDFEVDNTPGNNDMPTRIVFKTSANGSQTPTEAMRITSAQVVQITTADINGGNIDGTTIGASVAAAVTGTTITASTQFTGPGTGLTGTGSSFTAGAATNLAGGAASNIVYQSGAGATAFLANGTAGQVLKSNGASAPSWAGIDGGTF